MIYLELYFSFLQVGALGFGGGYAILPLIQQLTVTEKGWLTAAEFVDLVTISQFTPGPILLNSATFVGSKLAGPLGGALATFGIVTPSVIFTLILCLLYFKYRNLSIIQNTLNLLKPVVTALIAIAALDIILGVVFTSGGSVNIVYSLLAVAVFILWRKVKMSPLIIIFGSGFVGLGLYYAGFTF